MRGRRLAPKLKGGVRLALLLRLVDQAVNGGCTVATLGAHDAGSLAGESREQHLAVDAVGNVLGERGLPRAGIAEQAEYRRLPPLALPPLCDCLERGILVRREV